MTASGRSSTTARASGQIRRIVSQFSFGAPPEFFQGNIRAHSGLEPLGCLGDLGWYCIRFTLCVLDGKLPARACGHLLASHGRPDSPAPVPTEFSAELFFPEGVSASLYCSFLAETQQWANVSGTKGFIHVPDFVLPHYGAEVGFEVSNPVFHVTGCDFNMEDHRRRVAVREYSNSAPNSQEANMFRNFAALALSGRADESWGAMVLKTHRCWMPAFSRRMRRADGRGQRSLTNQILAVGSVLRKRSSSPATFCRPLGLGWVPSGPKSSGFQTRSSSFRPRGPSAQGPGPAAAPASGLHPCTGPWPTCRSKVSGRRAA